MLHTAFRPRLATTPLCFANPSPPSGWVEDFHLQAVEHARHTNRIEGLLAFDGVKLVIADDHKGLRAAARRVFDATHQRCRVHWMRNALAHAPTKQRMAVAAMIKTIFAQEARAEAMMQWDVVADALREKQPKLGALMDASREDVLAYMDFPKDHWPQISSTNPLERLNKEIKRRSDVIGIFPNDDAIARLVGALMLETNDEWTVARRYMSLETLARVANTDTVRLPTAAV